MKKFVQFVLLLVFIAITSSFLTWLVPEKTLFSIETLEETTLNSEVASEQLLAEWEKQKQTLSPESTLKNIAPGLRWSLHDASSTKTYHITKKDNQFVVSEAGLNFGPLLPPILAIGVALITKEVLSALFLGIYAGICILLVQPNLAQSSLSFLEKSGVVLTGMVAAFFRAIDQYAIKALADSDHASVIIFSLTIGGMVGIISASGGLQGIVARLSVIANNSVKGQFATFLMGIFVFFDDYANCLIVGNTTRPLTDKLRISREKLSFLVDATSAPVASIALISTWIGYEVGLIGDQLSALNMSHIDPYSAFIQSLPYRFYAFFMMFFVLLSIFMKRDFGPMYRAEIRARETGHTLRPDSVLIASEEKMQQKLPEGVEPRWYNAVLPIVVLIFAVLGGMFYTGYTSTTETLSSKKADLEKIQKQLETEKETLVSEKTEALKQEQNTLQADIQKIEGEFAKQIINNCNSYKALLWASLLSSVFAIVLILFQRILRFQEIMNAWTNGVTAMIPAIIVLILAWSLGSVISDLNTKNELAKLVSERVVSEAYRAHLVYLLPSIIFFIASLTALATGTSWGTMGILFPIVIPLTVTLTKSPEFAELQLQFLYMNIGAVLTGAIFGDHCSPISDTTILSSMACSVDHMDHVQTQMPYALVVGFLSIIIGYLPAGYGWPLGYTFLNSCLWMGISILMMAILLFVIGKPVPSKEMSSSEL